MIQYIVRYYWTGSYCSGWTDSRPFDTFLKAQKFAASLKRGEYWKIIERTEKVLLESTDGDR